MTGLLFCCVCWIIIHTCGANAYKIICSFYSHSLHKLYIESENFLPLSENSCQFTDLSHNKWYSTIT